MTSEYGHSPVFKLIIGEEETKLSSPGKLKNSAGFHTDQIPLTRHLAADVFES